MHGQLILFRRIYLFLFAITLMPFSTQVNADMLEISFSSPSDNITKTLKRRDFDKLSPTVITTSTPWTAPDTQFEGVKLSDLLAAHGITQFKQLKLTALNDYATIIPASDLTTWEPIVAIKRDGKPMTVRNLGPAWVIYPLSRFPEIDNPDTYQKMIWQLLSIEVER